MPMNIELLDANNQRVHYGEFEDALKAKHLDCSQNDLVWICLASKTKTENTLPMLKRKMPKLGNPEFSERFYAALVEKGIKTVRIWRSFS